MPLVLGVCINENGHVSLVERKVKMTFINICSHIKTKVAFSQPTSPSSNIYRNRKQTNYLAHLFPTLSFFLIIYLIRKLYKTLLIVFAFLIRDKVLTGNHAGYLVTWFSCLSLQGTGIVCRGHHACFLSLHFKGSLWRLNKGEINYKGPLKHTLALPFLIHDGQSLASKLLRIWF